MINLLSKYKILIIIVVFVIFGGLFSFSTYRYSILEKQYEELEKNNIELHHTISDQVVQIDAMEQYEKTNIVSIKALEQKITDYEKIKKNLTDQLQAISDIAEKITIDTLLEGTASKNGKSAKSNKTSKQDNNSVIRELINLRNNIYSSIGR